MLTGQSRASAETDRTDDEVEAFYERYPYPGGSFASGAKPDVANAVEILLGGARLDDCRALDAGCGTGQRLLELAARYPEAKFVGIDISDASLRLAAAAAKERGLPNVEFRRQSIWDLGRSGDRYDLVVSTGVIHHLQHQSRAIACLAGVLRSNGLIYCWLYHALGEFERLIRRELVTTLCTSLPDPELERAAFEEWDLEIRHDRYGASAHLAGRPDDDALARDMDAFFHPQVTAFRFGDLPELFRHGKLDWLAVHSINVQAESWLVDPMCRSTPLESLLAFDVEKYLRSPLLRDAYGHRSVAEKLRVIELLVRPTGFSVVAGKINAMGRMTERIRAACLMLAMREALHD